jgi:hypothetical protein
MRSASTRINLDSRRTLGRLVAATVVGATVVTINLLQACSFKPGAALETPQDVYSVLDMSPYVTPTESDRETVIDNAALRVEHGWSCAQAPQAASSEYVGLRIIENVELKPNFNATVFMNGWHLEYLNSDHHVIGLGSTIFNVVQLNNELVWNAGGVISDDNGDDPYKWCYAYTVVEWSTVPYGPSFSPFLQRHIDMEAFVSDPRGHLMYVDGGTGDGSLHAIPGSFKVKGKKPPRARLLTGFGNAYLDDDHHVLQVGFDLGPATIKARKIKWTSQTVLKDDSSPGFRAAEVVSVLRGDSVNVWHPDTVVQVDGPGTPGNRSNDWTLAARSSSDCPNIGAAFDKTYEYEIPNVPYDWAIPMLTGWDIGDICEDNHVKHIGAWIDSWTYVKNPGSSTGTLHYVVRTNFGDDDNFPGMQDRVKVDVLGIDSLGNVILTNPVGTLSGAGTSASASDADAQP